MVSSSLSTMTAYRDQFFFKHDKARVIIFRNILNILHKIAFEITWILKVILLHFIYLTLWIDLTTRTLSRSKITIKERSAIDE